VVEGKKEKERSIEKKGRGEKRTPSGGAPVFRYCLRLVLEQTSNDGKEGEEIPRGRRKRRKKEKKDRPVPSSSLLSPVGEKRKKKEMCLEKGKGKKGEGEKGGWWGLS